MPGNLTILPYNPGMLPTAAAPSKGERIVIEVAGLPPYKQIRQSIRNVTHPRYDSFVALRAAATHAMAGRAWYFDAICLDLTVYAPKLHEGCSVRDYVSGVMDTLDGSCGSTFTYLPIVYQDDCQVVGGGSRFVEAQAEHFRVEVEFL
jgi:hypothetical protein